MSTIAEILNSYSIPYDKELNKKVRGVYRTPNAIILHNSFCKYRHNSGLYEMCNRINAIDNPYIYMYLDNITSEQDYQKMIDQLSENVDINRIVIITDLQEIINIPNIMNYSFGIYHTGAIWTLIMKDFSQILQNRPIIIPSLVYGRAIAIMNDDELEYLNSYNIVVSDEEYENLVHITRDTYNNKEPFAHIIKFIPLEGQRVAGRLVDNVTTVCEHCNKLVYVDRKHKCVEND